MTTRTTPRTTPHSVLMWQVALVAGVVAGTVFLVLSLLLATLYYHVSPWIVFQYIGSIVLGASVLPPPAAFNLGTVLAALVVNYALAIVYTFILAFIIHRWGLIVGIVGGALYGAALYFINVYSLTLFFPWLFAVSSVPLLLTHITCGATAGGVYELLDIDEPGIR